MGAIATACLALHGKLVAIAHPYGPESLITMSPTVYL